MSQVKSKTIEIENLVIGTGAAGLMLALKLATRSKVLLISKGELTECNSYYAQGGIASVLDVNDSLEQHAIDTIQAGAGLCHEDIVKLVVSKGPKAIQELLEMGVDFTKESQNNSADNQNGLHLTIEGGHSQRRVAHCNDITGQVLINALIQQVKSCDNITICPNQMVIDLITSDKFAPNFGSNKCLGAYIFDRITHEIYAVKCGRTFLATGGHGRVYLYTSNPDNATGDGLAMAWRAGCRVANLEFMQFHPTCLFHPKAKTFLISEAVRGEGGILKDASGRPFMDDYHPMGSLAPRDIVARAIDNELKKSGQSNVFLDIRHLNKEKIIHLFPNIYSMCLNYGIDISNEMIPVVPAAHYSCGGIVVDANGKTNVERLFALGEVACTGLHGSNRLASNSLLEALAFADIVAEAAFNEPVEYMRENIPTWSSGKTMPPDEQVVLSHNWGEIRRLMWHYVGIVRSDIRLQRAKTRINAILNELDSYYWNYQITESFLEVRNLAQVAELTIRCALGRKESRGIHYTLDYPNTLDVAKDTIIH